jgi:hypothetical protein
MKLPDDATIPREKITAYLLKPRTKSDKSKLDTQRKRRRLSVYYAETEQGVIYDARIIHTGCAYP